VASFESVADLALPDLCADCPLRNLCGDVEMARMDGEMLPEAEAQRAAIEADVASSFVLAAVYKQQRGCEGAIEHDEVCSCGNSASCGAYTQAVKSLQEVEE